MRIGFANIYAFRPHVEHLFYLSTLIQGAGHQTYFLTCDAAVANCYSRAFKGAGRLKACGTCVLGGVRSYPVNSVTSISRGKGVLTPETLDSLVLSSAATLVRIEADSEANDPAVRAVREGLYESVGAAYESALRWIADNHLDAVVCFNGRMDLPRAVTYACEQAGIPYITHERTWFGRGIHLVPNGNCLSLKALHEMAAAFEDRPLTRHQAGLAGKLAAERFLQRNIFDWRIYNKNPEPAPWPLEASGARVLVLPSSKNEVYGHGEWQSGWRDSTQALDDFLAAFCIDAGQVVVRCHPSWAENIGPNRGERAATLYENWARKRGVHCIYSEQKANTLDLIQQADIVVMNGGSSAIDAGVCGKQVICLGPSTYQTAGFVRVFSHAQSLREPAARVPLDPDTVIRKTLRFIYLRANRYSQYVDYVRAIESTRYEYFDGADPDRLIQMLATGRVAADDGAFAADAAGEDEVVALIAQQRWQELAEHDIPRPPLPVLKIGRRFGLGWLDGARNKLPRGDIL